MKDKIIIKFCVFYFVVGILIFNILYKDVSAKEYTESEIKYIKSLVKPTISTGKIIKNTDLYSSIDGNIIGKIYVDTVVEILQDKGRKWYLIKNDDLKIKGYVKVEVLEIDENSQVDTNYMTKSELEKYSNINEFNSDTEYFIWVDIDRQVTNVFKGSKNNWNLEKMIICSTGDNKSPTTRGYFKISEKGEWFYSERLGSGAKYWVRFNGSYLFHSVAMDKSQNVIDSTIGKKCSNGCVRMNIDDIKWLYETVPPSTLVYIN